MCTTRNYAVCPAPNIIQYGGNQPALGSAGNSIAENSVICHDATISPLLCQFPELPVITWKGGFNFLKNQPVSFNYSESACELNAPPLAPIGPNNCVRRFQRARKDSYHYLFMGHSLGLPTTGWTALGESLVSINVPAGSNIVTVTTAKAHLLGPVV